VLNACGFYIIHLEKGAVIWKEDNSAVKQISQLYIYNFICHIFRSISGRGIQVTVTTTGCLGDPKHTIRYLEHVQVRASMNYEHRGDLILHLVSPNGTRSTLLPKRPSDQKNDKFDDWPFMSVHFWGEKPVGEWKFVIENGGPASNTGEFYRQCISKDENCLGLSMSRYLGFS
jgi:hypothetical protein